ncbi:hypothetical protein [Nitrospira sp. BLG_1]|uniref:hypothetical protein n=1 Tax=Nitrospira sp. BLG_1 TaxID=3395883 RepID=UPI0039BC38F1
MIDAARRWKARAEAGCAEAPAQNHKLVPLLTSTARQSRFNGRGEKVLFRETEATKPMRRSGKESASRLRDGLERDVVVDQQATDYVPDGR